MELILLLDLAATAVFAYSGSLAAKRRGFHFLGIFYIAFLTAVGGGTIRTLLLQSSGLFWIDNSAYGVVIAGSVLCSYMVKFRSNSAMFYMLDNLSLAIFVSIGIDVALAHCDSLTIAIGMGSLTGIGGGLIRDAITSQHTQALSDPVYPLMIITGVIGSFVALYLGYQPWTLACALVFVVSLISTLVRDRLPSVVTVDNHYSPASIYRAPKESRRG